MGSEQQAEKRRFNKIQESRKADFQIWMVQRAEEARTQRRRCEAVLQDVLASKACKMEEAVTRERQDKEKRARRLDRYRVQQEQMLFTGFDKRPHTGGAGGRVMSEATLRPHSAPVAARSPTSGVAVQPGSALSRWSHSACLAQQADLMALEPEGAQPPNNGVPAACKDFLSNTRLVQFAGLFRQARSTYAQPR